jgi:hypothetical protein
LRPPNDPRFIQTKFLIPIAVAALLEGTKIVASFVGGGLLAQRRENI